MFARVWFFYFFFVGGERRFCTGVILNSSHLPVPPSFPTPGFGLGHCGDKGHAPCPPPRGWCGLGDVTVTLVTPCCEIRALVALGGLGGPWWPWWPWWPGHLCHLVVTTGYFPWESRLDPAWRSGIQFGIILVALKGQDVAVPPRVTLILAGSSLG